MLGSGSSSAGDGQFLPEVATSKEGAYKRLRGTRIESYGPKQEWNLWGEGISSGIVASCLY